MTVDDAIAEFLEAERRGEPVSLPSLLAKYADVRADLEAFLADHRRFQQAADPMEPLTIDAVAPPGVLPTVRYFGDYELLEESARGGMGVVYQARQVSLDRTVALKMILRAGKATPVDVARFRIEAEAAASLDHPHIVPIYEVGEFEGQQYFAMKYIDGPTLARTPRETVKAEVVRLEAVTRAVHYAHQRGILHRDLKPGNVLLDAAGRPYVTDFGLAKRMDAGVSLTETNAWLGTAGYISPEQAHSEKGLTTATDTFSLGTMLYERLTGQLAFPGDTIQARLRALDVGAVVRPTQHVPTLSRDLETVCLKCLEREPAKRYATAEALADDLGRWLRGEPITARRTGAAERLVLWARRNPHVAGLTAGVAASLVAGMGVSTYFAVDARAKATAAIAARDEANAALAEAERAQVRGWMRPMGFDTKAMNKAELLCLNELAEAKTLPLRLRFLEEALARPEVAIRLARRAPQVTAAVVGADPAARNAAAALARRYESGGDVRQRLAAVALLLELGREATGVRDLLRWQADQDVGLVNKLVTDSDVALDESASGEVLVVFADALVGVLGKTAAGDALRAAAAGLAAVAPRLPPADALRVTRAAADALVEVLGKPDVANSWYYASTGLAAVAPRLPPADALRVADALVGVLGKTADGDALRAASTGLAAVAPRLPPADALRVADALVGVLGKTADGDALRAAAAGLAAVAPRLPQADALRVADALVGVLGKTENGSALWAAAEGLAAVAPRLPPADALRVADALVGVLGKTENGSALGAAAEGVAAVAPRLPPADALRVADALVGVLGKTENGSALWAAAEGLAAVAPRLPPADALRVADALVGVLGKTENGSALWAAAEGLAAVAPRLPPADALRVADALVGVLGKTENGSALGAAAEGLAAVAPRLPPADALRVTRAAADALVEVLGKPDVANSWYYASTGLAAVAPRLPPADALRVADALVGVLGKTENGSALWAAAEGLAAVAPRLPPADALRVTRAAADALVEVLGKPDVANSWYYASTGLAAVAPRLPPADALRVADALVGVLGKTENGSALGAAGAGLAAVAPRLPPADALRVADALVGVLGKTADGDALRAAAAGLAAVAPRLPPADALGVAQRARAALHTRLQRSVPNDNLIAVAVLFDQYGPHHAEAVRRHVIDRIESWESRSPDELITALITPAALAHVLRHPQCVGKHRRAALDRLEYLAFPLTPAERALHLQAALAPDALAPLAAGQHVRRVTHRRFHTVWDAVAWLEANHKEIDLTGPFKPVPLPPLPK